MPRFIAFLRAINVGGHNVKMEELRSLFESLGFSNVKTFIASGNVIFDTDSESIGGLKKTIEAYLHKSLGYEERPRKLPKLPDTSLSTILSCKLPRP